MHISLSFSYFYDKKMNISRDGFRMLGCPRRKKAKDFPPPSFVKKITIPS
jgi:hypothetical protein